MKKATDETFRPELRKESLLHKTSNSCRTVTYLVRSRVWWWRSLGRIVWRWLRVVFLSFLRICLEIVQDVGLGVVSIKGIREFQNIEVIPKVTEEIIFVHPYVSKVSLNEVGGTGRGITLTKD